MKVMVSKSVSSRAAETARDLSRAQALSRNYGRPPSANAQIFAVAQFATARSLGVLRQPRDDSGGIAI